MQPKTNLSMFVYSTMCRTAKRALNWKHLRWMLLRVEHQPLVHALLATELLPYEFDLITTVYVYF